MTSELADRHVLSSAMFGRVVQVIADEPAPAVARLCELDGVAGRSVGTKLFDQGVPRILGNHASGAGSGGLSSLASEQDVLAACRVLVDQPLLRLADAVGARVAVDAVSPSAAPLARSLYPDAVTVPPDAAAALAAGSEAALHAVASELGLTAGGASVPVADVPPASGPENPAAGSPFDGRVTFVLGAPRSGTTWLTGLLLSHPDTAGPPTAETWVFQALSDLWANEALATWVDRRLLASMTRTFVDTLFAAHRDTASPGATWFVEKSPVHVFRLDTMAATYPDAAYVHLLRDGRDVARSLVEIDLTEVDSITQCAEHWVACVKSVRAHRRLLPRFTEVRYEELLADPIAGVSELQRWIGLDVDPATRQRIADRMSTRVSRHGTTGPVGSGKWESLPPEDLDAVMGVAGRLLADLGYAPAERRRFLPGLRRGAR